MSKKIFKGQVNKMCILGMAREQESEGSEKEIERDGSNGYQYVHVATLFSLLIILPQTWSHNTEARTRTQTQPKWGQPKLNLTATPLFLCLLYVLNNYLYYQ